MRLKSEHISNTFQIQINERNMEGQPSTLLAVSVLSATTARPPVRQWSPPVRQWRPPVTQWSPPVTFSARYSCPHTMPNAHLITH